MTNALDKDRIVKEFISAAEPGKNTLREVDKVMARIRKGEFDVEEQVPELVVHAQSILDDIEPHDQKAVEACRYIVKRWERTKGRRDPVTIGTRSDLDDAKIPDEYPERDAVQQIAEATQAFIDGAHGEGQYIVQDWAIAIHVRYLQGAQEEWASGLPEMVTYATEPSGTIIGEIGLLQTVHEKLVRIAANGTHLAKGQ